MNELDTPEIHLLDFDDGVWFVEYFEHSKIDDVLEQILEYICMKLDAFKYKYKETK